jgi:hypothetical protein
VEASWRYTVNLYASTYFKSFAVFPFTASLRLSTVFLLGVTSTAAPGVGVLGSAPGPNTRTHTDFGSARPLVKGALLTLSRGGVGRNAPTCRLQEDSNTEVTERYRWARGGYTSLQSIAVGVKLRQRRNMWLLPSRESKSREKQKLFHFPHLFFTKGGLRIYPIKSGGAHCR